MSRGQIFVISAPSGAGKSSVATLVRQRVAGLHYSVSLTTRAPRPGEVDGVDYHFVSHQAFQQKIEANEMAEWAEVFGNRYGTSAAVLADNLDQGRDVFLDIDIAGAAQLRTRFADGVFMFILPPSREELARRLSGRGTEDPEQLARRLSRVDQELAAAPQYTHLVVNDVLEQAAAEVAAIITAERLRTGRQLDGLRQRLGF